MNERISLDGAWEFRELGAEGWKHGNVPGCVQLDLLALGEVPDPFVGMNEIEMHRLEPKEWVYRKTFSLDAETLEAPGLDLVFEGIDTLADVYLNGEFVGRAENMFIPYRFDVSDLVLEGENTVEVHFDSPITTAKRIEANSPFQLESVFETARVYVRKAQYSYGWDWGPRITQVGLWRPVYLERIDAGKLYDPFFYTETVDADGALVRVSASVEAYVPDPLEAEVIVALGGAEVARQRVPVAVRKGIPSVATQLRITQPQLWWPNGMGGQPLYDVTIRLLCGEQALDELRFRSGIRTVRVIQEADAEGRSFIFDINGERVFCKGANWIPADSLLPRLTAQDYYALIGLARDANMNMLRIWGGGIYEDPAFYEACDEMGIMVWQDFMYACAQYPDELEWFQDLARDEADTVVRALRNHPSIVLWCGNNENNWGFVDWWDNGTPKYLGNTIYREILPEVVLENDPSRPYWVSSPYGGEDPNGMSEGDRHSWTVWSRWADHQGYLADTGRFISEFGFQAMPNWKTVHSYAGPQDLSILSPVMLAHQKMNEGMEKLLRFMVGRMGLPADLQSFVYLSQLNQADAIKTGVEHWRRRKFRTSGALYWQFNDCWPVASWSCLDYARRKKGLWYASRRFFDAVLPSLHMDGGRVALTVVNDLLHTVQGSARVAAYRLSGDKVAEQRFDVELPANDVVRARVFSLEELGIGYVPRVVPVDESTGEVAESRVHEVNGELLDTVLFVELEAGGAVYRNYLLFGRYRGLNLTPARADLTVEGDRITLRSDVPAFGVVVEPANDVDLSDNYFVLEPGVPVTITCSGDPGEVRVFSLTDMVARI